MITTRIYQKVCDSCKGAGVIPEPLPTSTSITRMCPACNEGVVLVTETIETNDSKITDEKLKEK